MKSCSKHSLPIFYIFFALLLGNLNGFAQNDSLINDYSYFQRKLKLNALVVGRYTTSLNQDVDFMGQHHTDKDLVSNSFEMQYARLSTTFFINDRISTSILLNLADFKKENVKGKVLENAFVTYYHNSFLKIRAGQFRPFFGLEDLHPFQLDNSYAWSRQYSLFGRNGWQSFQIGAAAFGSLKSNIFSYYLTIYNGNNKNVMGDNDSSKNLTLRLEYRPIPVLQFGLNGGKANYKGQKATAYGIDAQLQQPLGNRLDLAINTEFKKGTNFEAFRMAEEPTPQLNDYMMEGFYFLYKLRYQLNAPRLRALELSCRHEYLDKNTFNKDDEVVTYTPMLSLVFAGTYDAKLSLVGHINEYKLNIPNTTQYDSSKMLIQFQVAY
ncbi:porin [uncultured Salegentibacter sp.]|uniref:porin n=1 Tax=uncultured Salegentibacter sp. TaxID=259320 RepID=UPI0025913147|nr:porin [uncultured Salegentibacter sp.]